MKLNLVKTFAALALSAVASVGVAHDNPFCGYYVGASLGGSMTDVSQDQVATTTNANSRFVLNGPVDLKADNSFKGALFAGFGKNWDALYLGAEIFVDASKYKNRDAVESISVVGGAATNQLYLDTHSKLNSIQFGIDLRPGFILSESSMLYGRIGASFSDLDIDTLYTHTQRLFVGALVGSNSLALSESKDVVALRLGAGLEQAICQHLNLRFDYIYTYYGKVSAGDASAQAIGAGTTVLVSDTNIKVYNNSVMLGLSYQI